MSPFFSLEASPAGALPDGLRMVTAHGPALGRRADLTLFTPPEAATAAPGSLPIVVLLHGMLASHWAWALDGQAHRLVAQMIASGELPPLVLVMPSDGGADAGSGYVPQPGSDVERWVLDEVPAAVAELVPAADAAGPFCLGGLSMGGFGALRLAGQFPQRILAAAGLSAATRVEQLDALLQGSRSGWADDPARRSVLEALTGSAGPLPPLHIDCGVDDALLPGARALHQGLLAAGIAHHYAEYPGGHDWDYWRARLPAVLRFFGRALRARATATATAAGAGAGAAAV